MLTMLHAYALEGGTGVQCLCKSWLHEDCDIAIDTGQYWAAKDMSRILYCETQKPHVRKLDRAYFNSARSITHYIKYVL